MPYRKFNATQLFTGYSMLSDQSVLITDEKGVVNDIVSIHEAGDDIETFDGILSPGFINCHCHLELSHMREVVPRNTGMIQFLLAVVGKRQAGENNIREAMEKALAEMSANGIVAVGDICNTANSAGVKSSSEIYFHNFVEALGFSEAHAEASFQQAVMVYEKFVAAGNVHNTSIVPHSPYSVADALFQLINDHRKGSILSIHNQESIAETEFFTTGKGELLELYAALGIDASHFVPSKQSSLVRSVIKITGDHSLILVHNVNTTADDLDAIRRGRNLPALFWCLCPNANLYITGDLPDVTLLKNFNSKIVIGTDSLASNGQLSVLEELKVLQEKFNALHNDELLRWATINGAEALRVDNKFGSFESGKQPGVVLIEGADGKSLAGTHARRIL